MPGPTRKTTDIGVDRKAPGEAGNTASVPRRRRFTPEEIAQWSEDNAAIIRSWNEYVEEHGLPLRKYRTF